jgi:hypothetical protein
VVAETPRGRVAVRSTSGAVQRLLSDALPGTSSADEALPQGFGVRPAGEDSSFHWLYWGRCPVARTRDAHRLVGALEHHLSAATSSGDWLVLRLSAGITTSGEALLLPAVGADIARVDHRLRDAGVTLVDAPFSVVDPGARELVVEPPRIVAREEPRRELVEALGTRKRELVVVPGRYALAQWAIGGAKRDRTTAGLTAEMLRLLAAPTTRRGAEGASELVSRLPDVIPATRDARAAVELLDSSS